MATSFAFKPIVTGGLVFCLDAGNTKSYRGSGTNWLDLTTNGNNGTLVNGGSGLNFISTNGGSILFDGIDDYVDLTSSSIYSFGTSDFSINFWIKTTDVNFNVLNPKTSTGSGFWGLLHQSSKLRWNNSYNVSNLWEVNNSTTLLDGNWHNVCIVRNSSNVKVYYDTESQTLTSSTDNTNYSGQDEMRMGSGNLSPLNGNISIMQIYNRALSSTEVLQNYNATKNRFI